MRLDGAERARELTKLYIDNMENEFYDRYLDRVLNAITEQIANGNYWCIIDIKLASIKYADKQQAAEDRVVNDLRANGYKVKVIEDYKKTMMREIPVKILEISWEEEEKEGDKDV